MALRQAGKYIEDEELLTAHDAAKKARLACEMPAIGKVECKFYPKFTIFFDGTMNNFLESNDNKSNVARLFLSAYDYDRGREFYPRYITGVGTPYEPKDNPEVGVDKGGSMGAGFGKGGEMRLQDAILYIEKTLGKNYTTSISHIKMLRINVIGFSRGATLARAFVNKLLKEKSSEENGQLIYKLDYYGMTVPLEIGFLGLFDTVASVGGPAFHKDWGSELRVPSEVKRCIHLVAAHEVRKAFPLDSIEYQNQHPNNSEEVIYPGVHSDVGGGYYPNEQGRSLEYTKIPLREMYLEALKAGVALKSLREMDDLVRSEFIPKNKDELVQKYQAYMNYVNAPSSDLVAAIRGHRPAFFRWHSDVERSNEKTRLFAGLAKEADCSACLSAPEERIRVERNEKMWASRKMKDATGQGKELVTEHKRLVSRMKFIAAPYERVGNENVDRKRTDYEELIFNAWNDPKPLPSYISEFFEEYVHDSVAAFDSWPCALYDPREIFMHRDTVIAQRNSTETDSIV